MVLFNLEGVGFYIGADEIKDMHKHGYYTEIIDTNNRVYKVTESIPYIMQLVMKEKTS